VSSSADPTAGTDAIRLVVTDNLRRSRITVLFRPLLAVPHIVWLWLFGAAAFVIAFVAWLAVVVARRPPLALHRFLASYVRYTTHVTAYLCLAANPYPGFTGRSSYPVDVELGPPVRQRRLGAALRLVLALPALLITVTLGGSGALGPVGAWLVITLVTVVAGLGWFASLVLGRMPRGMRDASAYAIGYASQTLAYVVLLTDRYPNAAPGRVLQAADLPEHPVAVVVDDDLGRPRLLVAFRYLLTVPHLFWLSLWAVPAVAAVLLAWLLALVLGRVPRFLHRFLAAFVRQNAHVTAFLYLVGRQFPGFVGREGSYPIDLTIEPPARQRRLGVLVRLLLAVPALLLSSVYTVVASVAAMLGWCVALVTGRMPRGLRDLGAASLRYQAQLQSYLLLLTSRYPDSSPVLEAREPAEEAVPA
jgi:hypothetical protein